MEKPFLAEIEPIFTTEELQSMYDEITYDVFHECNDLLEDIGFLMVPTNVVTNNKYDGTIVRVDPIKTKNGTLCICEHEFPRYGTHLKWLHFTLNDLSFYENLTFTKVKNYGLEPTNSWYYSYMRTGTLFPKHIDGKATKLRYLHSMKQEPTDVSFVYGDDSYFFPEGSSYIFNGEIPHIVSNDTGTDRLVYVGTIAGIGQSKITKVWVE